MLMAHQQMFCTEVSVRLELVGTSGASRKYVLSLKPVAPYCSLQNTVNALEFNTLKNEFHFSHSDRQTLHYIHFSFFSECDLVCVPHLSVQYC